MKNTIAPEILEFPDVDHPTIFASTHYASGFKREDLVLFMQKQKSNS
jgi:hypothetical protein